MLAELALHLVQGLLVNLAYRSVNTRFWEYPVSRQPLSAALAELRGQAVKRVSTDTTG